MQRYYFHTEDGECYPDEQGTELDGIEAAKEAAVRYLSERLKGRPDELWGTGSWRMTIQDETGLTLFLIDVSTTLSPSFPQSAAPKKRGGALS